MLKTEAALQQTKPQSKTIAPQRLIKVTYVCADELCRTNAFQAGVETVVQHPCEVGVLGQDDRLVVAFDHILWDDKQAALQLIRQMVQSGVPVGIHTFYPENPMLDLFRANDLVSIGKSFNEVR